MVRVSVDLETRSGADIGACGAYKYVADEDFKILLCAYAVNDASVKTLDLTTEEGLAEFNLAFGDLAFGYLHRPDVVLSAYNSSFEIACLAKHFGRAVDAEFVSRWVDTMAHAAYCGYPMSLEAAGKALGLGADKQKLMTGKALIRYFCTPQKPSETNGGRKYNDPHHDPEEWKLFKEYNAQDVEAEREIERMLERYPVPESEWELWRQDVCMNAYGARVDRKLIEGALYIDAVLNERLMDEAKRLTGLDNPNSATQLLGWLEEVGCPLPNLQKATVADALDTLTMPENIRRVLEIRQQLGKTSNKKYQAAADAVCYDDRVRGLMQFYGANRSGRWAGRLVQIQNLPRG